VFDHKSYTEKSLARMIKAKAKADRAAARQSNATSSNVLPTTHSTAASLLQAVPLAPAPSVDSTEPQTQTADDALPHPPTKESAVDRTELLRSKPAVVGRFMQLMVPILIDVYAASVITPVRVKSLTGLLKAVSFLDGDGIRRVLKVRCMTGNPAR
jgi:E3 ubiquitin-protein ligase TRIP12